MRVLVFGASITQGFWDTEGGWVNRLRRHYDALNIQDLQGRDEPYIFNLGISGDTTSDVLARFQAETKARVQPRKELAFIFSIGTNNAAIENGRLRSSFEEYRLGLEEIINQASKFSDKIMLVGIAPCDEKFTTPVFWRDIHYKNENLAEIDKVMQKVAAKKGLSFVTVFEEMRQQMKNKELFADGLHPNNAGHELIFQLVRPELDKLLAK